jgi:collagen type VII alpha
MQSNVKSIQGQHRSAVSALKARLLSTTAVAVSMIASTGSATANDLTFNGVAAINTYGLLPGGGLWSLPVGGTTVANVNTTDVNTGLLNGIWTWQVGLAGTQNITVGAGRSVTGNTAILSTAVSDTINIANNGRIASTVLDGIYAQNTVSGDITVSGAGTYDAARNAMWLLTPTGNVNVGTGAAPVGAATGALNGIVVTGGTGDITVNATSVTGTAGNGIWTLSGTGDQSITATGLVTAGLNGVLSGTTTGNITTSTAGVNSTGFGVVTTTIGGNTAVRDTATINAVNTAIWTSGATGNTTVTANNVRSTGNFGIFSTSTSGNNTISTTGTIDGATNGILSVTSSGNTVVTGNGTSAVTGGIEGIYVNPTTTGNATITDFASVTGDRAGIWTVAGSGVTSIQGNGPITGNGNWGVLSQSITGDINVGNSATNGVITGALIGLQATSGTGNINVTTNADVIGTGNIGLYTSSAGNTVNTITAGNVTGGIWGMDTLAQGTGNITNNIAAGSTVSGGVVGLITGTIGGTSTTNNAGIITTTGDTGAAGTVGGLANWSIAGTNIVNNTGQLIGGVATAGFAHTLNNAAGAVWTPSANGNAFASVSDTVNNAGIINIRAGTTTFAGLEALNNRAGGHINMAYNGAATDNLAVVNISANAGSAVTFNFDAAGANNSALGFDNSANGLGTADTIVVTGTSAPQMTSIVNLVTSGTPASLTGSVALIYTGVNLVAPAAGAVITSSSFYTFGTGNPSAGATRYYLVDDGRGGVYLQWAPNLSAAALGAYGGAVGAGAGSGTGSSGSGTTTPGSAIGGAAGTSAGIGGVGLGGGPAGGGVAGRVQCAGVRQLGFGRGG